MKWNEEYAKNAINRKLNILRFFFGPGIVVVVVVVDTGIVALMK